MTQPEVTYKPSDEVDFAIVGSGAAGGVLAKELVQQRVSRGGSGAGAVLDARKNFPTTRWKFSFGIS